MEREEEDNVRHELDMEFDSLRELIYAPDPSASFPSTSTSSLPPPSDSDSASAANANENVKPTLIPITLATSPTDAEAAYDQCVHELAFAVREHRSTCTPAKVRLVVVLKVIR